VALHPAEIRGYRELFLTGRQLVARWPRLADALDGTGTEGSLRTAAETVDGMLAALEPLTVQHGLGSRVAAQGSGARLGLARSVLIDRFLDRNVALRLAVTDLEHVTTLLAYLARASDDRGHPELARPCRSWEQRLAAEERSVRDAAVRLGSNADAAIQPLDSSLIGRVAHRAGWTLGAVGEWVDRRISR
jgi:hypothetical protein